MTITDTTIELEETYTFELDCDYDNCDSRAECSVRARCCSENSVMCIHCLENKTKAAALVKIKLFGRLRCLYCKTKANSIEEWIEVLPL